jgi:hypothetical protein
MEDGKTLHYFYNYSILFVLVCLYVFQHKVPLQPHTQIPVTTSQGGWNQAQRANNE